MIDRTARRQAADIIRSYMNEEIGAFRLRDSLDDVRVQTEDRTVKTIILALWRHYDDLKDHKIVASKERWDYFHRLLLILESDAEIETNVVRTRTTRQLIAACALLAFLGLILWFGWSLPVLAAYIALGVTSILLSFWRSQTHANGDVLDIALSPFSSVSELLAIRRRVPQFKKKRYPSHLKGRTIRHWLLDTDLPFLSSVVMGLVRLLFAPAPLAFQALPEVDFKTRVRIPLHSEESKR
ncbi:MAG: hypothetical protein GX448_02210 [Planctomycetes bacterium]|nr:hypothetical protein [Planctomycetota bacterium]